MIQLALGRIVTASKKVARIRSDCFDLLRAEHIRIELALARLRLMRNGEGRRELFARTRKDIEDHMALEEELFYPAAQKSGDQGLARLVDHGKTDHELVKALLREIALIEPETRRFTTLLTKLIINLESHVMDEENRVFPAMRRRLSGRELKVLSQLMLDRKKTLEEGSEKIAA
jgi:iron-sulfur cluster repair protein YtfE (RIC family)